MIVRKIWLRIPAKIRGFFSSAVAALLPIAFPCGKKIKYQQVEFRVKVCSLSEFRRSIEFADKEGAFTESIYACISRHSVIYDFGAHVGYYALLSAALNPAALIFAFEPHGGTYTALRGNIRLNSIVNISCIKAAVSDINAQAKFEKSTNAVRAGSGSYRLDPASRNGAIRTVRFDDWLRETKSPVPTMIIMDIEGSELAALRGMTETLNRHSVDVFMEVHEDLLRAKGEDEGMIDQYFEEIGYSKDVLRQPRGLAFEHKQKHVRFYKKGSSHISGVMA